MKVIIKQVSLSNLLVISSYEDILKGWGVFGGLFLCNLTGLCVCTDCSLKR